MTVQKSFKQRVRARMAKTGERYAAARRQLEAARPGADAIATPAAEEPTEPPLAGSERSDAAAPTVDLGMSSEALRRRTGRGWEEWLPLLDAWGAAERSHPQIATYLRDELGVDGWWAQGITVGYERARGMRAVGQLVDGYSATASKTVPVPVERLYEAFVDPALRERWLPEARLTITTASPGKSVRGTWADEAGASARLDVELTAKGPSKSAAAVQITRLPDAEAAARAKARWRAALAELARALAD